jgi:DNA-binding transcriptional MerR regulator
MPFGESEKKGGHQMATNVLTVRGAALRLGLPGPWTLRRLEARGLLPRAKRTPFTGERYYLVGELEILKAQLAGSSRSAE